MLWVIGGVVVVIIIGIMLLSVPMRIPRRPELEGEQKGEAVSAYGKMGQGPLFRLERTLVIRALRKCQLQGICADIGCGPGYLEVDFHKRYPSLRLIGLDNNTEMIDLARRNTSVLNSGVNLVIGDVGRLPFAANSLDFIVTSLSLHHWKDPVSAFSEIKRVLKPGGSFLIFDLKRDSPRIFYSMITLGQILSPGAIRRTNGGIGSFWSSYTPAEIKKMLAGTSFTELKYESRIGWMVVRGRKSPA